MTLGLDVHFVVPGALAQRTGGYLYDAAMVRELRGAGRRVTVHEVPGRFPDLDDVAREALATTLAHLPDGGIVIIDGLAGGCAGSVLAEHAHRLRLISLVHHPLADEEGLAPEARARYRALEAEALSYARGVIVTSPFTAARIADFGVTGDRVRAVLPGTTAVDAPARPDLDAPVRLLCVATLTPRKGQVDLVQALAGLVDRSWQCALVGSDQRDPDYAGKVRQEITDQGLDARIRVVGEVDEQRLEEEWRQATLFVLPSWYEGYGMALAEALARGLPVVSTTGGAVPWTVPDRAGLLVPPGDVAALREALARLLDDPDYREELGHGALRAARTLPDWSEQGRVFAAAVVDLAAR